MSKSKSIQPRSFIVLHVNAKEKELVRVALALRAVGGNAKAYRDLAKRVTKAKII